MHPARTIRLANESDLTFVQHLQRTWSNNLGFLPTSALQRYLRLRQCLLVLENDTPAGYLNWSLSRKGLLRIIQVAIDPDLLRTTLGTKVMRHVERAAHRGHCSALRLTSRVDLPANQFWPILTFQPTAVLQPRTTRNQPHIEWTKPLLSPANIAAILTAPNRHPHTKRLHSQPYVDLSETPAAPSLKLLPPTSPLPLISTP